MAFPQGINFRTTVGFVTDGANEDPEAFASGGSGTYPRVTAQGNTVGWEGTPTIVTRDRDAGNDRRLAGIHYNNDVTAVLTYRIDLPSAGTYQVNWASGDPNYVATTAVDLYDTTTRLRGLSATATLAADNFRDATDVNRTAATWPTDNAAITATFSTTILRLKSVPDSANNMIFTHVRVAASGGILSGIRIGRSRRQRAGWSVSSPGSFF